MTVLGADPDQLEELATSLDRTASQMENASNAIDSSLRSIWWEGHEADRFRSSWGRSDRPALVSVAGDLREASRQARRNASQQRLTSGTFNFGAAIGSFAYRVGSAVWRMFFGDDPNKTWFEDEGIDQLASIRYQDGRQAEWWAGLEEAQRQALLDYAPGEIAFMDGLPDEVRAEARQRYIESMKSRIETDSTTSSFGARVEFEFKLKVALGVEGSVETQNYADGSTVVTLGLDSDVAAGLGLPGVGDVTGTIDGGVAVSYRFDSPEEAQEFLDGLAYALLPNDNMDKALLLGSFVPVVGLVVAPMGAHDLRDDGAKHLDKYEAQRESLVISGAVGLEASAGGDHAGVSVRGELGASHDFHSGETTIHFERSAEAHAGAGTSASVEASIRGEAIFDGAELVGFKLSADASAEASMLLGGVPGVADASLGTGQSASFEASIDLTDPVTRQAVQDYLQGGDVSVTDLLNRAEIVAYTESSEAISGKAGASAEGTGISVGGETTTTERGTTYVKPPGGDFIRIDGAASDPGMASALPSRMA